MAENFVLRKDGNGYSLAPLPVAAPGVGLPPADPNTVIAGPASGSKPAAPAARGLVPLDVPALPTSKITGLQAALDGKAKTVHTHATGDVTGLQASLDGKAAASHAHSAADITSGTIPVERIGTGTKDGTTVLHGDNVFRVPAGGGVPGPPGPPGPPGKDGNGNGPKYPPRGVRTADIRDFGAVPNDPNAAQGNSLAVQAAHDSVVHPDVLKGGQGTVDHRGGVYVPSGTWYLRWPVWLDGDYVEPYGEGSISVLDTSPYAVPVFIIGKKRVSSWNPGGPLAGLSPRLHANHRVDLSTVPVMASAVGGPDQRWGLRSRQADSPNTIADHYIQFVGTAPATGTNGDKWYGTRTLSLSLAISNGDLGSIHRPGNRYNDAIIGMGHNPGLAPNRVLPWVLMTGDQSSGPDGKFHFYFCTEEGNPGPVNYAFREFTFGDTSVKGVVQIEIEMDFTQNDTSGHCYICVYMSVDGGVMTQVPVTRAVGTGGGGASFTAADDLHFRRNEYANFNVFSWGGWNEADFGPQQVYDGILYGLRVGNALRYKDLGVGQPQERIDNAATSITRRYFEEQTGPDWNSTLCILPLTDPPHDPNRPSDRYVTLRMGSHGIYSLGLFCEHDGTQFTRAVAGVNIHDLRCVSNPNVPDGFAITAAQAIHLRLKDADFIGGWGGIYMETSYDYKIINCEYSGRGPIILGKGVICEVDGMRNRPAVRGTLVTMVGSKFTGRGFVTAQLDETVQYMFLFIGDGGYGNVYSIDGVEIDQEWTPGPKRALIRIDTHVDSPRTELTLSNIRSGNAPHGVPVVELISRPGAGRGFFTGSRLMSNVDCLVCTNGRGWTGIVRDSWSPAIKEYVRNDAPDGLGGVVVEHLMDALPTTGKWAKGSHVVNILNPEPGTPSQYLCSESGEGRSARWAPLSTLGPPVQAP